VLAGHGLVEPVPSADGRERPWRATITGFSTQPPPGEPTSPNATSVLNASLQLDYHLAREYLRTRDRLDKEWRDVDSHSSYGLRVTPNELSDIVRKIDAVVRPYIAATRENAPADASIAMLSLLAFPRPGFD
jgi:hypothetical protein